MAGTTTQLPLVERLWLIPELAEKTGVSQTTWRREVKEGRLAITDTGSGEKQRAIRIADSEVRRWLASRTTPARRTA